MSTLYPEEILQAVSELCMDGIVAIDDTETIVYLNETYCKQLGVAQEEFLGKKISDVVRTARLQENLHQSNETWGYVHTDAEDKTTSKENPGLYINRKAIRRDGKTVGAVGCTKSLDVASMVSGELKKLEARVTFYEEEMQRIGAGPYTFSNLLANSAVMRKAIDMAQKVSRVSSPVLLLGETGTGKEVFASAIHFESTRSKGPLIKVNCAALPPTLIESELFGYEAGAFSGAKKGGNPGKFELANNGTIFLDEIGDLPFEMQSKLLRVLQEQEVMRIGGTKPIKLDFRLISATNQDLEQMVREKKFREDLYYRLSVFPIMLPPLRERKGDIPRLAGLFLEQLNYKNKANTTISESAYTFLESLSYEGNLRQLRNIIERAFILCSGDEIGVSDLTFAIEPNVYKKQVLSFSAEQLEEKRCILELLEREQYHVASAAEQLGMHRVTLYKKMRKYGISTTADR